MKPTDVMLVFLMLLIWGQNYVVSKDIDLIKQRVGTRAAACVRLRT